MQQIFNDQLFMSESVLNFTQKKPVFRQGNLEEYEMGVVFGTPSKNCDGAGVCMISRMSHLERLLIPCFFTVVFLTVIGEGYFVFRVPRAALSPMICQKYFGLGVFKVEESFFLPRWLVRIRGKPKIRIPPGIYRVEIVEGSYKIHFNILQYN